METAPVHVRHTLLRDVVEGFRDISTLVAGSIPASRVQHDFLQAYDRIAKSSTQTRSLLFQDPRMAIWIATVETAILDFEGRMPDEATVASWTSELSLFALAAAMLDRHVYATSTNLRTRSVFLPGSKHFFRLQQHSPGPALLSVNAHGSLSINGQPVELERVPEAGGLQLVIDDPSLCPPDVPGVFPLPVSEVNVTAWLNVLKEASALIMTHPPSVALAQFGPIIMPVRGTDENTHCSVSFDTRPGVLYMSWAPSSRIIAEAIVHEADHQLLYVLTRRHSFWNQPYPSQASVFRSPWREDPRPLDGLLRGASAFVRVGSFWNAVLPTVVDGEGRDFVGRRIVLALRQSLDALSVITRFERSLLSRDGHEIVGQLRDHADSVLEKPATPSGVPLVGSGRDLPGD